MAGRATRMFVVLAVVVSILACDQVTKKIATRQLAGRPRLSMIADSIRLEYAENRGGFLSVGTDLPDTVRRTIFNLGTAALLGCLGVWVGRRTIAGGWALGPALLWAGGAGNLVDRIARGSVIDFLNIGIGGLRTGIFNAADMAITAGLALVVVEFGRQEQTRQAQESPCRRTSGRVVPSARANEAEQAPQQAASRLRSAPVPSSGRRGEGVP